MTNGDMSTYMEFLRTCSNIKAKIAEVPGRLLGICIDLCADGISLYKMIKS